MQLQQPFAVVTTGVDGAVLHALAATQSFLTVADLQSLIPDRSVRGIRDSADRLVEQGIARLHRVGNAHAYQLNDDHLAAQPVRAIAGLRSLFVTRLAARVAGWSTPPRFGAVFGSAARGTMRVDSDIDILLIPGPTVSASWDEDVAELAEAVTAWTGNDARVIDPAIEDLAAAPALLSDILNDATPFIGDLAWLRRTTRLAKTA